MATLTAGTIASGIHYLASKSGETSETLIVAVAAFLLCTKPSPMPAPLLHPPINSNSLSLSATAATYARFIPELKARFDYGLVIFILTFNLIAVSGYRVDGLLELAQRRLATIAIGISICLLVCILVRPVWAGEELRSLIVKNMRKLADSIDESVSEYFGDDEKGNGDKEVSVKNPSRGYRCVLNSKASEESLLNLARWEPRFSYKHPWGRYVTVGAAMRYCAYCVDTLNACIHSENEFQQRAPDQLKKHLSSACIKLGIESSTVLKELATSIESMKRPSGIEAHIGLMNDAVEEVHRLLGTPLPEGGEQKAAILAVALAEATPTITVASLLNEIAMRIEGVVDSVEELAEAASFVSFEDERGIEKNKLSSKIHAGPEGREGDLQQV